MKLSDAERQKQFEIDEIIRHTPRPVFKVVKVPKWAQGRNIADIGDRCAWVGSRGMLCLRTKSYLIITQHNGELEGYPPSSFEFLGYRSIAVA